MAVDSSDRLEGVEKAEGQSALDFICGVAYAMRCGYEIAPAVFGHSKAKPCRSMGEERVEPKIMNEVLSALDVINKFQRSLRGYDPAEVDDFLDLVAESLHFTLKSARNRSARSDSWRGSWRTTGI